MNAQDWQAAAEVFGVILILLNLTFAGVMYRMQAKFVTRAEHSVLEGKVGEIDDKIDQIETAMAGLFTNKDADNLKGKMQELAVQNARLLGELPGLHDSIQALAHQTRLLNQHALNQAGKN
jgi:predicted  nucleic acid-binding Zn-ribbon protein